MRSRTRTTPRARSRGTILPMVAICMVAICGFVALAVDVGMMAVAKTEAQNAADAAALAGARSIDGSASPDLTAASATAKNAAKANQVLAASVVDADVAVQHGTYRYDISTEKFSPAYTLTGSDTYNLTKATITRTPDTGFGKVFGIAKFNVSATAIAAHRPRDVSIILDFSGSMNDESDLWNSVSTNHLGSTNATSNNTDSVFPKFGPYSAISTAYLKDPGNDPRSGKSNVSQSSLGIPALVDDFYAHSRGGSASSAFSAASSSYATAPDGDRPLYDNGGFDPSAGYAISYRDLLGSTGRDKTFELDGYDHFNGLGYNDLVTDPTDLATTFKGYTRGPRYWGKTFFIWPPDPRAGNDLVDADVSRFLQDFGYSAADANNSSNTLKGAQVKGIYQPTKYSNTTYGGNWPWPTESSLKSYLLTVPHPTASRTLKTSDPVYNQVLRLHNRPRNDWRQKFFLKTGGSYPNFGGPLNDNTKLWTSSSGYWLAPSGNYVINYKTILAWIKQGPNPFPSRLRAGRILYYDQIPDDVPSTAYDHTRPNTEITDPNKRFWKEYIDYALGVWRDPDTGLPSVWGPGLLYAYSSIYAYNTSTCSYGPDFAWVDGSDPSSTVSAPPTDGRSMNYIDNPRRPRHRAWFGPMTMIQFLSDTGLMPGTAHDISTYPAKLGISGALQDIKNNHPNDLVSMILFNRPQFDNEPAGNGTFNAAKYSLSRDYSGMIDSLWFPPNSGSADVRPWDVNGLQTPRAANDYTGNTATIFGFMLAYNQFSGNSALRTQTFGGLGRKGAQRLVVLETDGMANVGVNPTGGFSNQGSGKSYYNVRPADTVNSASYSENALLQVVQAICNKADGSPGTSPGYSSNPGYSGFADSRKPVQIHTIAFGALFEPTTSGSDQATAVNLLQQVSTIGGTRFPSSASDPDDGYKWCIGSIDDRKNKLRQAFSKVMDDGVSVSLIQ